MFNLIDLNSISSVVWAKIATIAGLLIGTFIVKKVFHRVISEAVKRVEDDDPDVSAREQRAHTLADVARNTLNVVLYLVVAMMVLSELNINIAPIITGAGILGLAIGFGAQTLVKDIVTGFFILLEGQFNKGDNVEIALIKGRVKEIKLRTTVLKGENGEVYIIPNSQITKVTRFPKTKDKKK